MTDSIDYAAAQQRLDEIVGRIFRLAVAAEHERRRAETREADRSADKLAELAERHETGHIRSRREALDDAIKSAKAERALAEARTRAHMTLRCYATAADLDRYLAACEIAAAADVEEG